MGKGFRNPPGRGDFGQSRRCERDGELRSTSRKEALDSGFGKGMANANAVRTLYLAARLGPARPDILPVYQFVGSSGSAGFTPQPARTSVHPGCASSRQHDLLNLTPGGPGPL